MLNNELASRLKKAESFRNIAVHNFESNNWGMVHSIVKYQLADFSEFAKVVATRLNG
ncbi:MAG: HepT-like ribonuclease domain-containing protein [Sulfuricella sp.]